jgi:hypothetical protein
VAGAAGEGAGELNEKDCDGKRLGGPCVVMGQASGLAEASNDIVLVLNGERSAGALADALLPQYTS